MSTLGKVWTSLRWKAIGARLQFSCFLGRHTAYKRLWRPVDDSVPLTTSNAEWHLYCVHCDKPSEVHVFDPADPEGARVPARL